MAISVSDVGSIAGDFGGAISDLFAAQGAQASETAFKTAAQIETENARIEQASTAIKEQATARQLYRTVGAQKAGYGAANLKESGSAIDVLKSSMQEGAIQQALVGEQGQINENSYLQQAAADTGLANSAGSQASADKAGGILGGIAGAVSSIISFF